jgi:hypothetical protein
VKDTCWLEPETSKWIVSNDRNQGTQSFRFIIQDEDINISLSKTQNIINVGLIGGKQTGMEKRARKNTTLKLRNPLKM